jgi:hypothetical protein
MYDDDTPHESFEDKIRAFARELGRSAERINQVDVEEIAESFGVDPERARDWADSAGRWLREHVEDLGDDIAARGSRHEAERSPEPEPPRRAPHRHDAPAPTPHDPVDPLRSAAPHPLDLPTDEQGTALAALDSGRWTVEAGSNRLTGHGDGSPPNDALGLVRELRARDWIDGAGEVTVVGHHALQRWLASTNR